MREVHIVRNQSYWPELSRVMPEAYSEFAAPNEPNYSFDSSDSLMWNEEGEEASQNGAELTLKRNEERLEASCRGLLARSACIACIARRSRRRFDVRGLLDCLGNAPLLSDELLTHIPSHFPASEQYTTASWLADTAGRYFCTVNCYT